MADDDKPKTGDELLAASEAFKKLSKTVEGLAILVQQGQATHTKTQGNFDALIKKLDGMSAKPKEKDPDPEAINDLDNKDFLKIVLNEMGKLVDKKVGVVSEQIEITQGNLSRSEIKKQIIDLGRPDFFEWTDEMRKIAEHSPNLSVKQLYSLAREENETKATEMDEKYVKKDDKPDVGLLSLMPTSGMTAEGDEKLTKEQAMDKAWDDTLENFPGLAHLGDG